MVPGDRPPLPQIAATNIAEFRDMKIQPSLERCPGPPRYPECVIRRPAPSARDTTVDSGKSFTMLDGHAPFNGAGPVQAGILRA